MKRIVILTGLVLAVATFAAMTATAQGETKKSVVRLSLLYTRTNDEAPVLQASAKVKPGKRFEPLEGVEVALSFLDDAPSHKLGVVVTDAKGNARLTLAPGLAAALDSLSTFKFMASVAAGERFDESTTETEITRARIDLSPESADSTRRVTATVLAMTDGKWTPVAGAEVKIFVKRLYSDLPIGEDVYTSNEAGEVSADFTMKIPGDATGTILVGAKLDENETYGTVSAVKPVVWGVPVPPDRSFYERSLWASRDKTPLWLLIVPNIIIAAVWGFIFYLVYLVIRIRRIGMDKTN